MILWSEMGTCLVVTGRGRSRRRPAILVAAISAALLLSACGGSSTLSHSQLAAKAGAECRRANQAAARLTAPAQSYSSLNQYARGLSPIVHTLIGNLTALKAGGGDRATLTGYVGALRNGSQGLDLLATASTPAQVTQAHQVLASQPLRTRAGALGAPACGAAP
jgi:hypothetical protein